MCTREPRLVLVSLLIGWKSGARTFNQSSLSEVIITQSNSLITFDTQLKTALCSEMSLIRCMSLLRVDFNKRHKVSTFSSPQLHHITRVSEYRWLKSQSVPQMLLITTLTFTLHSRWKCVAIEGSTRVGCQNWACIESVSLDFARRTDQSQLTKLVLLIGLLFPFCLLLFGDQGWRSDESTRLPPMWPGFDSQTRRHVWIEFVGSLLCTERFFSGYSGFPLSSMSPNRPFATNDHMVQNPPCWRASSLLFPTGTLKQRDLNQSSLTCLCFNVPVGE